MSGPDPFLNRVGELNDAPFAEGSYVLYWMQRSQRVSYNHALEYAVRLANERDLPLLVGFGLTADYPQAALRHYRFMVEGLQEVARALEERGVRFVLRMGSPPAVALDLGRDAAAIVCDRGYLAHLRAWRYDLARTARCRVIEVESDLVVPVEQVSTKQEYAARTIRPRIHRKLADYLVPLEPSAVRHDSSQLAVPGESLQNADALLRRLGPRASPGAVGEFFRGGADEANRRLQRFLDERLGEYEEQRSEPGSNVSTELSPYLHFGQISDLEIALRCGARQFAAGMDDGEGSMKNQRGSVGMRTSSERVASARDALLEELLVRRGLAYNYVWFTRDYDSYEALPDWARRTLGEHASDEREHQYGMDELLGAATHDEHWNNAMREMLVTGYMHNYMRMYWGKKILEWTPDPREAFERVLTLNNTWFLDGRDPNSYANVAWVFGRHDRPWTERAIFGKVRYMNANGLKRKFDMDAYQRKVDDLAARVADQPEH